MNVCFFDRGGDVRCVFVYYFLVLGERETEERGAGEERNANISPK